MPPYVTTFNPGFDPALPLYRPLAMSHAHKAAMDPRGPQPCAWDHYPEKPVRPAPPKDVKPGANRLVFVSDELELAEANRLVGGRLALTGRTATQLVRVSESDQAVASFTVDELYFAEAGDGDGQRLIARHGFGGTEGGEVLLAASNTDWSLFNRRPENAKVPAVVCYEQLQKPSGAVLVAYPSGEGRVFVTTVERNPKTVRGRHFLRRLCANIGVQVPFEETGALCAGEHEHDLLLDGPRD
jgi:beta-galactosidase